MKAFELRRKVIFKQKVEVEARILFFTGEGLNWCYALDEGALDDSVAMCLVEEGYDIKTIKRKCPTHCFSLIFWDKAEEGKPGSYECIEDPDYQYVAPEEEYKSGPKTLAELAELTLTVEFEEDDSSSEESEDEYDSMDDGTDE